MSVEVIRGEQLLKNKLNMLYAVGKGASYQPRLINILYNGNKESKELCCFIGKGICFDTGGYNIESIGFIEDMYLDKCGMTAVLAAIESAVNCKLKVNIIAALAIA